MSFDDEEGDDDKTDDRKKDKRAGRRDKTANQPRIRRR